jgi:MFS family permease
MASSQSSAVTHSAATVSAWAPFRHRMFALVWVATVVSNIGGWMYNAAAGWLMTTLTTDPLMVSLVQVANSVPVLIFAFPAGALADVVDKRKFLIVAETSIALLSTMFAFLVWRGLVGPQTLLFFVFVIGAAGALTAAPWQAVVPELVPKEHLAPAISLNSLGVNVSRALGSALGGLLIAALGVSAPFFTNGVSNAGVIGALLWWRPAAQPSRHLPAERLGSAMRTGFRHARYNPRLRAALIRATAFFTFASAYWALLPLVTRERIAGGPLLYGSLLGLIGVGATRVAGLGAWAWTGDLHHGVLWRHERRQRALGSSRRVARSARCALGCRGHHAARHGGELALQTSALSRDRPEPLQALAHARGAAAA